MSNQEAIITHLDEILADLDDARSHYRQTTVGYRSNPKSSGCKHAWTIPPAGSEWSNGDLSFDASTIKIMDLQNALRRWTNVDEAIFWGITPPPPPPPIPPTLGTSLPARLAMSSGAQYWLDPVSGNDANDGTTPILAWKTVPHAIAVVPLGSIVNVIGSGITVSAGGNLDAFRWNRTGGDVANPTTFRCVTPRGVTLSTGLAANSTTIKYSVVVMRGALRMEGFKIGGRGYDPSNGEGNVGVRLDTTGSAAFSGVEFLNCEITGCGGQGVYSVASAPNDIADVWFYRCYLHDNALDARAGTSINLDGYYGNKGSHHMYIGDDQGNDSTVQKGGYRWVIASCIFRGNMPGRHAQLGAQARSFFIVNNTFYGNTGLPMNGVPSSPYAGDAMHLFGYDPGPYQTSDCLVVNNIMAVAKGAAVYGSGHPGLSNHVRNNLPYLLDCTPSSNDGWAASENFPNKYGYPSGADLYTRDTNLAEADPKFTSPATGGDTGLHLLAGSPAIGVSEAAYTPPLDYDGNPRTALPNLGAY